MRVVAILAPYNQERFLPNCIQHLNSHGVEAYIIDNNSTDRSKQIAEEFLGKGVLGIETFPPSDVFRWREILERKEQLASTLPADWVIHMDPDEVRLPPRSDVTLNQALEEVDRQGYNCVNFFEFVFIPTKESPDHDHPEYEETMRWYYPYLPPLSQIAPHRLNAWKRQPGTVNLAKTGGHCVVFNGMKPYPHSFTMKHYEFLSIADAVHKYCRQRPYNPQEVQRGWHGWRSKLRPEIIKLPSQDKLRTFISDDKLDPSNPRTTEYLEDLCLSKMDKLRLKLKERGIKKKLGAFKARGLEDTEILQETLKEIEMKESLQRSCLSK